MKEIDKLTDITDKVVFDPEPHTYTLTDTGRQLPGLTSLLNERLFPDKYSDVPQSVLDRAAERGTAIHLQCQLYDIMGARDVNNAECEAYITMMLNEGLQHVASEYLVSDLTTVASMIDKVYCQRSLEDGVILADIKTTSKLDIDYVSWQLSVYARLFERQNPALRVSRLLAIWLPKPQNGTPALVDVPRHSDEEVDNFLYHFNPIETTAQAPAPELSQDLKETFWELGDILQRQRTLERRAEILKAQIAASMERAKMKVISCGGLTAKATAASTRTTFDTKAFRAADPDTYSRYTRTTEVPPTIRYKLDNPLNEEQ